jgi:hypothetical protein
MDYMKTVYARAAGAEMIQVGLTAFDKDFNLTPIAAESWSQSADGLTWTFKIRQDLNWSDGVPVTAGDFVFALQHAATTGYDFAWYWGFAGGIKNWDDVTAGKADVSTLGLKAVDDKTLEVTTNAPKPYLPSVVSLWYPVPKHQFDKFGDEWSTSVDTIVSSGPWVVKAWEKSNNTVTLEKNTKYTGPWQPQIDEVVLDSSLGLPEVGVPAFLAGDDAAALRRPDPYQPGLRDGLYRLRPREGAVRQSRCPQGLLLRHQPRRADHDGAQGHRHPGPLDPAPGLPRLLREDRGGSCVRSREGQGIHGQGRLPEWRRLPAGRNLVPRGRRL